MMHAFKLTVTDSDSSRVAILEVPADLDFATLKCLIESDFGVTPAEQRLFKDGGPVVASDETKLSDMNFAADEFLTLFRRAPAALASISPISATTPPPSRPVNPQGLRMPPTSAVANFDFSSMDFSAIKVDTPPSRLTAASNSHATRTASDTANAETLAAAQADKLLLQMSVDPHFYGNVASRDPTLANALKSGKKDVVVETIVKRVKEAEEEQKKIQQALRDPLSVEAQELLMKGIQQQNINKAFLHAQEYIPESFGAVVMLYVRTEVNGKPLVAFVDSGAQNTIMSKRLAAECNLLRLVDERFAGIAQGVGTSKIVGRVHVAQLKMGQKMFDASITVLEDDKVDFLFGLDLLRRYQCNIDLEKNVLCIAGEELPFLAEAEIKANSRGTLFGILDKETTSD